MIHIIRLLCEVAFKDTCVSVVMTYCHGDVYLISRFMSSAVR